jgi:iron(III) transport system substrate-binding protein
MRRQTISAQTLIGMLICTGIFLNGVYGGTKEVVEKATSLSGNAREDALVAGAKLEGQVIDYTTSSHRMSRPLVNLFQAKYPFISVKVARLGGSKIIQKIDTEAMAGHHAVDIIGTGELGIVALIDKGLVGRYASPMRQHLREGFFDEKGLWTVQHASLIFSAYNKTLIEARDLPMQWEDFLDPKWKGRMSLDTSAYGWAQSMVDYRGESKAVEYFKKLAKQNVQFLRGRSLQLQLLAAGEFSLTLVSNANLILGLKKAGAPIEPIRISPVFLRPSMLLLAHHAPHPHAAILYLDFLLSKDAQTLLADSGRLPGRKDVSPDDPAIYERLHFFMSDPLESGRNYSRIADLYKEILLGQ